MLVATAEITTLPLSESGENYTHGCTQLKNKIKEKKKKKVISEDARFAICRACIFGLLRTGEYICM